MKKIIKTKKLKNRETNRNLENYYGKLYKCF